MEDGFQDLVPLFFKRGHFLDVFFGIIIRSGKAIQKMGHALQYVVLLLEIPEKRR